MAITPVNDVWGVGSKITKRLELLGIKTALDLANCPTATIRNHFSIVLERTARELNGESCLDLEEMPPTKQQIMCSKSFGTNVTILSEMCEAIAQYTARACEKLRKEDQVAKVLTVFIQTNPFQSQGASYSNSATGQLVIASSDTRDLNDLAMQLLKRIWRDGYRYNKGGVMLSGFQNPLEGQADLFEEPTKRTNSTKLMNVLDEINQRSLGRVFLARQGMSNAWSMKREYLSPAYTTRWSDIPKAR